MHASYICVLINERLQLQVIIIEFISSAYIGQMIFPYIVCGCQSYICTWSTVNEINSFSNQEDIFLLLFFLFPTKETQPKQ